MIDPTGHEVHWNPHELEEDLELEETQEQEIADAQEEEQDGPEWDSEMEWDKEEAFRIAEEMERYLDDEPF